jgi:hypothetical protein
MGSAIFYLGLMLEMSPLTRMPPDTSDRISEFFNVEDDDGGSAILMSNSGIIRHIRSSSWTTSAIEGRASVSSWQHLRAKVANITKHSDGQDLIPSSITEKISPD